MKKIERNEPIETKIYYARKLRVMLDQDLASLYDVATKVFNQAIKRNKERFPSDFMFRLTTEEFASLRSQFVTLEITSGRGKHRKYLPLVFTEQGIAMLSGVLKSKRAVQVNIAIMRAFVRIKQILSTHKNIHKHLKKLEEKAEKHDIDIKIIFSAIRKMLEFEERPKKRIGFLND
ncbi:MAG: ORF6N domain-containing protein [bacterium]